MSGGSKLAFDPSTQDRVALDFQFDDFWSDVSSEQLEYQDRKARLQTIIDQMTVSAPSWSDTEMIVSADAARTAQEFLRRLPSNRELPKISPDGEGDLLLVWEPPHGNCIVTVQDGVLHMVDKPGTSYSQHVDEQKFLGTRIPFSILHAIPMR